jgi:hypothetical protein
MRHENLGMRGLEYNDLDFGILFERIRQHIQVGPHRQALNIDRRIVERGHGAFNHPASSR